MQVNLILVHVTESHLKCISLMDYATLNFNNSFCTATVFMDIEKSFDTTWVPRFVIKGLQLSASKIRLISSFLSDKKLRDSVEGEISTLRNIQAGVPQGSVPSPTLYNLNINDPSETPRAHLAIFADKMCLYSTDRKKG